MDDTLKTLFIMIFIIVIIATPIYFLLSKANKQHKEFFEYWSNTCRQDGGIVQMTSPNQVECFKDGQIINHVN